MKALPAPARVDGDALPSARGRRATGNADGASGAGFAAALVLLTGLAVATGAGLGLTLGEIRLPEPDDAVVSAVEARYGEGVSLVRMEPVVANLREPSDTWVRVDAALILEGVEPEAAGTLAAEIAGDTLAWLRTLPLARLEGASGLAFLREDLAERAHTRSDGRVREVVIETLVVQ
ncbi:flagellar basal body-associated FliL family protein [Salinarimonas sp.]|uniref:flagellar basal body-associated FliL family protein n=1 Tax=Salinarimonas sp. TaxID=2766526 RepID=UPI0032D8D085